MIASKINLMIIHCKFLTNVSIIEEHGIGIHDTSLDSEAKKLCVQDKHILTLDASKTNQMQFQYAINGS